MSDALTDTVPAEHPEPDQAARPSETEHEQPSIDTRSPDAAAGPDVAAAADVVLVAPQGKLLAEIPVAHLAHHPLNVRESDNYDLSNRFLASLKTEQQVLITVVPMPEDAERPEDKPEARWWVVKGNRRLAGADLTGKTTLECLIDHTIDPLHPGHLINQIVENDRELRRPFTPEEEATAMALALDAGASRTAIRKKTGRTREEINAGIAAGKLSPETKQHLKEMDYEFTLLERAMWAEFDDDPEAQKAITHKLNTVYNCTLEYAIERVKAERALAAEHQRIVTELSEAGVPITESEPEQARELDTLARLVDEFNPDPIAHRSCPGHGAYFLSWDKAKPRYYCTTPAEHGYAPRPAPTTSGSSPTAPAEGPSRKLVIEGRLAWPAAATVRQRWLAELCALKTPPKAVQRFVTQMLHRPPQALRDKLVGASSSPLYRKLGGPTDLQAALQSASAGRLVMLQFHIIAVTFEHQLSEASDDCKNTWRRDRHSPCSFEDATLWLRFLTSDIGAELTERHEANPKSLAPHRPAPIEQALIEGTPYRGDAAADAESVDHDEIDHDEIDEAVELDEADDGHDNVDSLDELQESEPEQHNPSSPSDPAGPDDPIGPDATDEPRAGRPADAEPSDAEAVDAETVDMDHAAHAA